MVLDGAMGTMIQALDLEEADYRGQRLADHPAPLKGNNDLLSLTAPGHIEHIHEAFLAAGADFLMYDMEHTGITTETLRAQMAACRGLDIAPLVRVPSVEANIIGQVLDIGAHGIMVPMVETAAQAEEIVRRAYYPPEGQRGTAFSIAHDDFMAGHPVEKMKQANSRTLVIAMIETAEGLKNVDQIAAVSGVDVLWLGHFDLTSSFLYLIQQLLISFV